MLNKGKIFSIILFFVFFISMSSLAAGKEITVDDDVEADFRSLQEAVNSSSPGDVIFVYPGIYNESVDIRVQNISVLSKFGNPEDTVVRAFGISTSNITVSGFSILEDFYVESYHSKISGNIIIDGNIWLYRSDQNVLLNNTLLKGGVSLASSNDNKLIGNNISNTKDDIGSNDKYGIGLSESISNIIDNNSISNANYGIDFPFISGYNEITNNTLTSNLMGIRIAYYSGGNILRNNTISNNNIGLSVLDISCSNNVITGNRIELNRDYGICLKQNYIEPSYTNGSNLIYDNLFNNTINFFNSTVEMQYGEAVTTFWNTTKIPGTNIVGGPHIGGNFWAKPDGTGLSQTCPDSNRDGICDLPYNINGSDFDHLPLATPPSGLEDGQLTIKETQIVTNESDQQSPAIYGDRIVWMDWRNGDATIYMYDYSKAKEIQITNNGYYYGSSPIYGDRIVLEDNRDGNSDIYMYNITTSKETQITSNKSVQRSPAIYEDRIVWLDYRDYNGSWDKSEIYMYDLATSTETRITSNKSVKESLTIYGNMIVWLDSRNGNKDIYMYDLSTHEESQIIIDKSTKEQPTIYEDRIIWDDTRNANSDIYMYNITTHKEIRITTNESEQHDPAIYGDKIVWTDYRNLIETKFPIDYPTPDIYMYDLSTSNETRITTSGSARNPSIYKDWIVWEDWRNGNFDIYMCTVSGEKLKPKVPIANFSINVTSGYAPLSVQFTDLSQDAVSRNWDFENDGTVDSTEKSPVHVYRVPGTYIVNLTAIGENNIASKIATINVLEESGSSGGINGGRHSSGGSGSGGAGSSPEPQSNVEVKEISQTFIASGSSVKFKFSQNITSVVYVSFDPKKTAGKTTAIVEMLKGKSTLVPQLPAGEIYKFLNIWVGNNRFATPNNIENAVVCLKIEKSWILDKKIDKSSITLNRYSDNKWDQLPTNLLGEDDKYLYLRAQTPAFSPFAITGKTIAAGTPIQPAAGNKIQPTVNDTHNKAINGNTVGIVDQMPEQKNSTGFPAKGSERTPGFDIICGITSLFSVFLFRRK